MGWLDGKRALVAGAGSGIGRAVLAAFESEGARIAALELDPAKAARLAAEMPGCVVTRGDATALADARAAVGAAAGAFGGLDVLVNCVGIFDFYRGLADLGDDVLDAAFDEVFAVNVKSQLVCVRAALPELRRARGSVVLTVSTSGFYPGRGGVLYVASKFAVRGCVIALAHELAPDIRVNGVAPGGTLGTELTGRPASGWPAGPWATRPAASGTCAPAPRCGSRSPATTTRAATCSWPPTGPAGSPARWCTPTAAWPSGSPPPRGQNPQRVVSQAAIRSAACSREPAGSCR